MNKSSKRSHSRETTDSVRDGGIEIPQSSKSFSAADAENFLIKAVKIFTSLSELNDLKNIYEMGKQLSRLYFDCAEFRPHLSTKLIKLEFPEFVVKMMKKLNNMGIFKHDDIWFSSFYFYNICWNYSESSFEFATALSNASLPSLIVMNLLHKPYLENLSSRNIYFLIKASLSIMHNLCRYPGNRFMFKSDKVKDALIDFTSREEELIRVISILCLAFLLEDDEAAVVIKQWNTFTFNFIDIITKAKLHDRGRFMGFATWELLQALTIFSSNDSVKKAIVDSKGLVMVFDILSKASNVEEVRECLMIVWNFAFDNDLKSILIKQHNGLQVIESFLNHEDEDVRNNAAGIKWLLEDHMKSSRLLTEIVPLQPTPVSSAGFHVYICFAEENREIVQRITDRLKRANLSLVLPKNSNLESALKNQENRYRGIVQSTLFLFVLSEASKSCQQCRSETQYAAYLKKPIIPVIVQTKFKPSGWMDKFTDKLFFDFGGKRDFEINIELLKNTLLSECMNDEDLKSVHSLKSGNSRPEIIAQLPVNCRLQVAHSMDSSHRHHFNHSASLNSSQPPLLDSTDQLPELVPNKLNSTLSTIESIKKWSKEEVTEWLVSSDLSHLRLKLSKFNGAMLASLLEIKREAPEYFYKCLEEKLELHFMDTLAFIDALHKLTSC